MPRITFIVVLIVIAGILATTAEASTAITAARPAAAAQALPALPVIDIEASRAIRDEPKVRARVRVRTYPASGGRARTSYDGWAGIEIRGASSRRWPKKSYGLELQTAAGDGRDAGLLGMPADDDWVLYAAYGDPSYVRNQLGYAVARWAGHWAPGTRLVTVRLNRRFHGVYVLTERVELGDARVVVPDDGDTGAFLLELTSLRQVGTDPHVLGPVTGAPFTFEDPKLPDLSPLAAGFAQAYIGRVEQALYSGVEDWRTLVDERSAVDFVLLQDLLGNADAFRASTYMVKPAGGPLRLGPIWDLDYALGRQPLGPALSPVGSVLPHRPWASALLADAAFVAALAARWRELRDRGILQAALASVDRDAARLAATGAVERDQARWPRPVPLGAVPQDHAAELAYLRGWLTARVAWMDATLLGS